MKSVSLGVAVALAVAGAAQAQAWQNPNTWTNSVPVGGYTAYQSPSSYAPAPSYIAPSYGNAHVVQGYVRPDGAYVAPHYQTNPNGTAADNYSTRGNINPYTGRLGTKSPY